MCKLFWPTFEQMADRTGIVGARIRSTVTTGSGP